MQLEEKHRTSSFRNHKGQNIFFRYWKNSSNPKSIVIIVHGLNSHSGYYENFALQLNENNHEVYAIDLQGRGHSDGERYYISDYKHIIRDIDQLLDIVRSANPALPVFLFGHSGGGVFASVYAIDHQQKLAGLICESFTYQTHARGFALTVISLLSYVIPHIRVVKLNNRDFTRNASIVAAMNKDPLLANEKQPAKTIQQLLLAAEFLKKQMPEIKLPMLILHGTDDKVTKAGGSKYFMEQISSTDKQLNLYEGHYHDLLNDLNNETVVSDILSWLNKRV